MFDVPIIYSSNDLKNIPEGYFDKIKKYKPIRIIPSNRLVLFYRLKLVWKVFIGKYDVIKWSE